MQMERSSAVLIAPGGLPSSRVVSGVVCDHLLGCLAAHQLKAAKEGRDGRGCEQESLGCTRPFSNALLGSCSHHNKTVNRWIKWHGPNVKEKYWHLFVQTDIKQEYQYKKYIE